MNSSQIRDFRSKQMSKKNFFRKFFGNFLSNFFRFLSFSFVVKKILQRLRHTLHQRTLYSKEHFASQELNTLGNPTHLAKSQFTSQHTLLLNTLCHSEPFTPHYTLLLNTLCHSEPSTPHYTLLLNTLCLPAPFASWSTLLLNTFCSMDRNPI